MIISWNTTNACNLKCAHCYRDSGKKTKNELTSDEAKKLLDEIAKAGFKIMIFSGGEPLLRPDILELLDYATKLGLIAVLGSNGTLLTENLAAALKKAGAKSIGISLDSIFPERHDFLRGVKGAWQKAVDGMENCRKAGLPFQIHTTVMTENMAELEEITDFAQENGAVAHHFFFLIPTGRGQALKDRIISPKEHETVLIRLMKKQTTAKLEIKPTCAPQFIRVAEEENVPTRFQKGCLAGTAYAIISPTGCVQPCAYLPLNLGDVRQTPFDEIWQRNEILKKMRTFEYSGNCNTCYYKMSCGGCRARAAFYADGDFMASDPWCKFVTQNQNIN